MKWIKVATIFVMTSVSSVGFGAGLPGGAHPVCEGKMYNPLMTNWQNMFPITIAGIPIGGGSNPPTLNEPAICICPSHLAAISVPGIGMTYHEPLYLAETTQKPGCLHSLGGIKLLSGYDQMSGPGKGSGVRAGGSTDRKQVHWMAYPIWALLEMFTDSICVAGSNSFAFGYATELDPIWQDDNWSNVFSPESAIFSNPVAHAACAIDAVSSMVYYPLDAIFWCAGAWGSMYPMSGNPNSVSSMQQSNGLTLAKFLARQYRIGAMRVTLTPAAKCFSFFSPIMVKTQFRIDPVYPLYRSGSPVYIGQPAIRWGYLPPMNFATKEASAYMLFSGTQCCLRP